jgi:hypothetical protein
MVPTSSLIRKLGVLHTNNPDHVRPLQEALETLAHFFSVDLDVQMDDVHRVIALSRGEVPQFANKVEKYAKAFLSALFAHCPERQPAIAAAFHGHHLFETLLANFRAPESIESLTCFARPSEERRDQVLELPILPQLTEMIRTDFAAVENCYRELGRLAETLSSFPFSNPEKYLILANFVKALVNVDGIDVVGERIFLSAYSRFFTCFPAAPADLMSTRIIRYLVNSGDYFNALFAAERSKFLLICAQDAAMAEFMLEQGIWRLLLDILFGQVGQGKADAAQAALCLVEINPDRFILEEVEGVSVCLAVAHVASALEFIPKSFLITATFVAVTRVADALFEQFFLVDLCLQFLLNALVGEPEEFIELKFAAGTRLFQFCTMAAGRADRLLAVAADCDDFLEWLPTVAEDERFDAAVSQLVSRICR